MKRLILAVLFLSFGASVNADNRRQERTQMEKDYNEILDKLKSTKLTMEGRSGTLGKHALKNLKENLDNQVSKIQKDISNFDINYEGQINDDMSRTLDSATREVNKISGDIVDLKPNLFRTIIEHLNNAIDYIKRIGKKFGFSADSEGSMVEVSDGGPTTGGSGGTGTAFGPDNLGPESGSRENPEPEGGSGDGGDGGDVPV